MRMQSWESSLFPSDRTEKLNSHARHCVDRGQRRVSQPQGNWLENAPSPIQQNEQLQNQQEQTLCTIYFLSSMKLWDILRVQQISSTQKVKFPTRGIHNEEVDQPVETDSPVMPN